MKRRAVALLAVLSLAWWPSTVAAQDQDKSGGWMTIKAIPQGQKLLVKLKDKGTVKGSLISVSDQTLELSHKGAVTSLERDRISKVYRLIKGTRGESVGRSTLIGAGIGFASGAGFGIAVGSYEDVSGAALAVSLGAVGAGIGAAAGAVTGLIAKSEKKVVVYEQ